MQTLGSRWICLSLLFALFSLLIKVAADEPHPGRKPKEDTELKYWLLNLGRHQFSTAEAAAALALPEPEIVAARQRLKIQPSDLPTTQPGELLVLPYPGGRHPRIGFLDGAIDPQRETKASVFLPWAEAGYVVVDIPEAIWSNLGLTYLAHTHVPTIWTNQKIALPPLEWERGEKGLLFLNRTLPNGIVYAAKIQSIDNAVQMKLTLTNGTSEKLSNLRIQNCVMLKGAPGFAAQTNDNKLFRTPFVAVHDKTGKRWVITAWERCTNAWGNAPCPCLHSDPQFADLTPGETGNLTGWLWCFEGDDIEAELRRLDSLKPFASKQPKTK